MKTSVQSLFKRLLTDNRSGSDRFILERVAILKNGWVDRYSCEELTV